MRGRLAHCAIPTIIIQTWGTEQCTVPYCFASLKSDISPPPNLNYNYFN